MNRMEEVLDASRLRAARARLTAAVYASRAFLKTLVIAGNPPGGQLTTTTDVENFPGFPKGIQGPELINKMRSQAEKFTSTFIDENVSKVSGSFEDGFLVETEDDGGFYKGRTVIVATGASARWLGLESEQRLIGKGVSACATCDGFFFKDVAVAVIGGGDAAMEEATFLTKFATKVYVLVRKDKENMKASKIMQKKAFDNPIIEFMFNTEVKEVLGDEQMDSLKVVNNQTDEEKVLADVKGLFLAIGHKPNTDFLKDFIELDKVGYVAVTDDTKTSKEGVFVAGDVADYRYRQAVTAAGFGCMAALDVEKFLAEYGVVVD